GAVAPRVAGQRPRAARRGRAHGIARRSGGVARDRGADRDRDVRRDVVVPRREGARDRRVGTRVSASARRAVLRQPVARGSRGAHGSQSPARAPRAPRPPDGRIVVRGQVVGRWAIEGEIATGGFGNVYEARHLDHRGAAAVKLLHPRFAASPEMRARFEREVDALRQLAHPNIVRLLDAGITPEGAPYLCMERLVGETLAARIERTGPLPFDHALAICRIVCDALAFTHARGMVHRDINASNVFLCGDLERVVLLDFGIAKSLDSAMPELTASHETVGTPNWMAPEQIRGQRVNVRSDVYAV